MYKYSKLFLRYVVVFATTISPFNILWFLQLRAMSPTAAMLILCNHRHGSYLAQETSGSGAVSFFRAKGEGFKRFLDHIRVFEEGSGAERSNVGTQGKNPSSEEELMKTRLRAVLEFCW